MPIQLNLIKKALLRGKGWLIPVALSVGFLSTIAYFLVASLNPLYLDEYVWRSLLGTGVRNGFRRLTIYPVCTQAFLSPVPWTWYLPTIFLEALYNLATSPALLRIIGVLTASINLLLIATSISPRFPRPTLESCIITSTLAVGLLPFYLVMARPEGILVMLATGAVVIYRRVYTFPTSSGFSRLGDLFLLLVGYSTAISIHPFGLTLLPIYVITAHRLLRRRWQSFVAILIFALMAGESAIHWAGLARCPESPGVAEVLKHLSGLDQNSAFSWTSFLLERLQMMPLSILLLSVLTPQFRSLGTYGQIPIVSFEQNEFFSLCFLLGSILTAACLLTQTFLSIKQHFRIGKFPQESEICLAILVTCIGATAMQPMPWAYRVSFFAPLLVLCMGLLLRNTLIARRSIFWNILHSLTCLATISGAILFCPQTLSSLSAERIPHRDLSIGLLAATNSPNDILEAAKECPLPDTSVEIRTATDASTYWAFIDSRTHLFAGYISELLSRDNTDLDKLVRMQVDQIVVSCDSMPEKLASFPWRRFGSICCLSLKGR